MQKHSQTHPYKKEVIMEIKEQLEEMNPKALLADGLDQALVGISENHFHHENALAVYDIDKVISILMDRDGMDRDGAVEFFEFNIKGSYVGKNTPLFIDFK
tara:strand:- start:233 stop:535 length:303 start_codon:yes stop_codon:yes gene_type:complete